MPIEKITRICWNTENWERPSGPEGKSKAEGSYEQEHHFGHEEWLFDKRMILSDGYLYGYLQALHSKCHKGKVYDIHLFAINSDTQDRLYVGCLRNAEVLTDEQRDDVAKECEDLHLKRQMDQDLKRVGVEELDKVHPNVRFKLDQVELEYPNYRLIDNKYLIGHRYQLMDAVSERLKFLDTPEEEPEPTQSTEDIVCLISTPTYVKRQRHKEIQLALKKYLLSHKGYTDVELEAPAGRGRQIDLKAYHKTSKSWHYFEIKVYDARLSIREALGQILEYAHYLSSGCKASKLFIVGPESPTWQDLIYLNRLRKEYNLPIEFVHCSIKDERLYWEDDIRLRVGAPKAIKQTTK